MDLNLPNDYRRCDRRQLIVELQLAYDPFLSLRNPESF